MQEDELRVQHKKTANNRKNIVSFYGANSTQTYTKSLRNCKLTHESLVSKSSEDNENTKFVVHLPKVLSEEPFKPKLNRRTLKSMPFNLVADKRVADRKKFDNAVNKKKERIKRQEKLKETMFREITKRELVKYRLRLVHQAKPVPDMTKPFVPQKSDASLTIPKSPTKGVKLST